MNYFKKQLFSYLFFFLCSAFFTAAQTSIHPGDANNNGRVEKTDFLYIGYAYDFIGPARINQETSFDAIDLPLLWDDFFPDDTNFAFADCDGNGWVNWQDLLVSLTNYSEEADNVEEVEYLIGEAAFDPQLQLDIDPNDFQLQAGSSFSFPLLLGTSNDPIDNFLGIAFTIEYDSDIIKDIRIDFDLDSWINTDSDLFLFQDEPFGSDGQLDAVTVRYGQSNTVSGGGIIGEVSIIIEDNLVDLLPSDSIGTIVTVKDIKMLDNAFNDLPVASDSINIMIYGPDAITNLPSIDLERGIRVFPNPTYSDVNIHSSFGLEEIKTYNVLGELIQTHFLNGEKSFRLSLPQVGTSEWLLVEITTELGSISKRILRKRK